VPEELAPVQIIGTLVLNGNPTNFFAETEQVAFHTGHLVPGIEGTNDPLLQGRNFSYLDTQLTRLGGPNFTQIPINRPHAPVNDNARDGFHQQAVHTGQAPYTPNRVDDGAPFPSEWAEGGYVNVPRHVEGDVVRAAPSSFDDHFSQAAMFYASLTSVEQQHVIDAYTFELGKCYEQGIKERALTVLAKLDENLCTQVALGLGLPVPPPELVEHIAESPALRQIKPTPFPIAGRIVGVVAGPGADLAGMAKLRTALEAEGALLRVIAPTGGELVKGTNVEIVERTFATGRSVEFDAIVVADGAPKDGDFRAVVMLQEMYRHLKAVGAWGDGVDVLATAGIDPEAPGVLTGKTASAKLATGLIAALGLHRAWDRTPLVNASLVPPTV
jgi:catalase